MTIEYLSPDNGNVTWVQPTSLNGGVILLYEVSSNVSTGNTNITCTTECVYEFEVPTSVGVVYTVDVIAYTNSTHEDLHGGSGIFTSESGGVVINIPELSECSVSN